MEYTIDVGVLFMLQVKSLFLKWSGLKLGIENHCLKKSFTYISAHNSRGLQQNHKANILHANIINE